MKGWLVFAIAFIGSFNAKASGKDSTINFHLPDSIRAVQFMAEITISGSESKRFSAGIKTDAVGLYLKRFFFGGRISFSCLSPSGFVTAGEGVSKYDRKFDDIGWNYDWKINETYKLLIAQATDSAGNFSLYSGYIFLPRENNWKFIGTYKIENRWSTIKGPAGISYSRKKSTGANFGEVWIQRNNGSWKYMKEGTPRSPVINYFGHLDSLAQHNREIAIIKESIIAGKTDAVKSRDDVYYTMLKEGSGRQVLLTDTVIAFYKGYLFSNGQVFDETKEKPASFPLNRLIRGWQIGVPLCRVGGKIKLVIPSALAYTIRTRAAKIPPNSILVFEIEVVDTKPSQ